MDGPLAAEISRLRAMAEKAGLDPGPVSFEIATPDLINQIAAYDGFPARYSHWRFGMSFDRLDKTYSWGLSQIYEMVINNVPAYAYLREGTPWVVQKMVVAHVFGHTDFFRHNAFFKPTAKNMINLAASHRSKLARLIDRHGREKIEEVIDACMSLDDLLDPQLPFRAAARPAPAPGADLVVPEARRFSGQEYMQEFLNPPDEVKAEEQRLRKEAESARRRFPLRPERDILGFLMLHAPLDDYEREIAETVRTEAYYFLPQRQTKIMNEGWAAYWHTKLMAEGGLAPHELTDYADENAKILSGGGLNPYKIGIELWRDIEYRWDHGRHGKEWEEITDARAKASWDKKCRGEGLRKMFEVRATHNDVNFIDAFLTPEFCVKHKLFTTEFDDEQKRFIIASREFEKIRDRFLRLVTLGGKPQIAIQDANYRNRGELLLVHQHEGIDLEQGEAEQTLIALHRLWRRPVHLRTKQRDKAVMCSYDGEQIRTAVE
jgi:stage V sporulation protein R